jgi:hypothetical protein
MSIVTKSAFSELVSKINSSTTERRAMIQQALAYAAYYSVKDRNADPALRLFAVVGRETNRQNMADWLSEYGAIGFKDGVPFFHEKKWKDLSASTLMQVEEEINNAPGWWAKRSATSEIKDTVDVLELIRAAIKRGESAIKKGDKKVLHTELLAQVAALLNDKQYS